MNSHLNVFIPYSQNSGTPIKNNLSRGVAILLNENVEFFNSFIDMLNRNLAEPIAKPTTSYKREVEIQKSISRIVAEDSEWVERIIPVTLTTAASDITKREKVIYDPQNRHSEGQIPDIIVSCADDLILIEVKKSDTNACTQVLSQAEAIRNSKSSITVFEPMNVSWEDIIKLLQDVQGLTAKNEDLLVNHYIDFLKYYHQDWFPAEPFQKSMSVEMIWKRIYPLAQNFAKLLNGNDAYADETRWSYVVGVDWGYVWQIHFSHDENNLIISFYPGNTKIQSEVLFSGNSQMDWTNQAELNAYDEKFRMSITPIIKFAIRGKHIWSCTLSKKAVGIDPKRIRELCSVINGKWKGNEYLTLVDFLTGKNAENLALVDDADFFKVDFLARIANNYKSVCTSLGYAIDIYMPLEKLEFIDRKNPSFMKDKNCDGVAKLALEAVLHLKNLIEGKDE